MKINIFQSQLDIKLACATAYVRECDMHTEIIHIYMNDFPDYIRKGFLYYQEKKEEIRRLIPSEFDYTFSQMSMNREKASFPDPIESPIYDSINRKASELRSHGIEEIDITEIISLDVDHELSKNSENIIFEEINHKTLNKLIDSKLILSVERFLTRASKQLGRVYALSTYYNLCFYLSSLIHNTSFEGIDMSKVQLSKISENNQLEYVLSEQLLSEIEQDFDKKLSFKETVFITLILSREKYFEDRKTPVVLVAMHGDSAASSVANTVNQLSKLNNTYSFDLNLTMDLSVAYDKLKLKIQEIHQGRGITMIYDMGSLKNIGQMVSKETGIPISFIEIPLNLMVLESARKSSLFDNVLQVTDSVFQSFTEYYTIAKKSYTHIKKQKTILTLCATGKGTAISMKNYLEKIYS